jgi:hypothetical protein
MLIIFLFLPLIQAQLAYFRFYRSQCLGRSFQDEKSSQIFGTLTFSSFSCIDSNGIRASSEVVTSTKTISQLKKLLGNYFAIELWIQPAANITNSISIFSLGQSKLSNFNFEVRIVHCLTLL